MSDSVDATLESLSAEERLSLIHALWDSLSDAETPLTAGQSAELGRRLASFEKDKVEAIAWESLRAEPRKQAG
jgi:putative addiction module component (TIGR02574 family)